MLNIALQSVSTINCQERTRGNLIISLSSFQKNKRLEWGV